MWLPFKHPHIRAAVGETLKQSLLLKIGIGRQPGRGAVPRGMPGVLDPDDAPRCRQCQRGHDVEVVGTGISDNDKVSVVNSSVKPPHRDLVEPAAWTRPGDATRGHIRAVRRRLNQLRSGAADPSPTRPVQLVDRHRSGTDQLGGLVHVHCPRLMSDEPDRPLEKIIKVDRHDGGTEHRRRGEPLVKTTGLAIVIEKPEQLVVRVVQVDDPVERNLEPDTVSRSRAALSTASANQCWPVRSAGSVSPRRPGVGWRRCWMASPSLDVELLAVERGDDIGAPSFRRGVHDRAQCGAAVG